MKRIHVTGGSGFLGRHVLRALRSEGYQAFALARSTAAAEKLQSEGAVPVSGDLERPDSLLDAFAEGEPEALLNIASLGFGHAKAIVAAAESAGVQRAVFVSTTAVFTTLDASSRETRLAAEETIRTSRLQWTIVRPTMIYGDLGDRNMVRLLRLLRRSPVVPLPGGGHRLQQPVHVEDLARAIVSCLRHPETVGESYDLAGPEPLSFRDVVTQAADAVGRHPVLLRVPLRPAIWVIRRYERLSESPRLRAEQLERLAEDKSFSIQSARRDLEFHPRPFEQGIRAEAAMLSRPVAGRS